MIAAQSEDIQLASRLVDFSDLIAVYDPVIEDDSVSRFPLGSTLQSRESPLKASTVEASYSLIFRT
jgi:hypothetical protein